MNILYVGDIMGEPGIVAVEEMLPKLRRELSIDLVLAQAENVTAGRGMSLEDKARLEKTGVDIFTGGNHSLFRERALGEENVIRPANYLLGTPGVGHCVRDISGTPVLAVSLLGHIVGKDADKPVKNPLQIIDELLGKASTDIRIRIVNFHGDYSSEKRVIGYYLDSRVTAVIGDHWHVPTADAMILPKGTAHITDVGMCGTLHSSLGVKTELIIDRWHKGTVNKNELETARPLQFNAVLITADTDTGLATGIEHIQRILTLDES